MEQGNDANIRVQWRSIFFQKRSLVHCDLGLKFNFKILKINFKQTLTVPARKWVKFLKMAGCWPTHRFLSCRFWSLARVGSLPDALGHATPSKSLPGAWWGILIKNTLQASECYSPTSSQARVLVVQAFVAAYLQDLPWRFFSYDLLNARKWRNDIPTSYMRGQLFTYPQPRILFLVHQ